MISVETLGENPGKGETEMIMVDGKAVELDVWLKGLRREWTKRGSDG
jgi:hypothetical protein